MCLEMPYRLINIIYVIYFLSFTIFFKVFISTHLILLIKQIFFNDKVSSKNLLNCNYHSMQLKKNYK